MGKRALTCLLAVAIGLAIAAPLAAAESAPADNAAMNPFSPSAMKADLALWTAVVFLCVLAILARFAWKPLMAGLDKREQGIADQIAQAEAANQQAKELLAEHQRKLAAAGDEVRALLEQGRRQSEQLGRELMDKAKQDAKAEQERALRQIDAAADAAMGKLADQSAALAVELAGKIVRAELKPRDHAQLIEQAVAGFVRDKAEK
jgi:F-type H+-transporting ATPase subunit b